MIIFMKIGRLFLLFLGATSFCACASSNSSSSDSSSSSIEEHYPYAQPIEGGKSYALTEEDHLDFSALIEFIDAPTNEFVIALEKAEEQSAALSGMTLSKKKDGIAKVGISHPDYLASHPEEGPQYRFFVYFVPNTMFASSYEGAFQNHGEHASEITSQMTLRFLEESTYEITLGEGVYYDERNNAYPFEERVFTGAYEETAGNSLSPLCTYTLHYEPLEDGKESGTLLASFGFEGGFHFYLHNVPLSEGKTADITLR